MSGWSQGYVSEVDYIHGFYREMVPEIIKFACLSKLVKAPFSGATLDYCELGCGQGVTANVIAAANPRMRVYANDFNPSQIAGAQALARDAGTRNVFFYDHSFEEFIHEPSLPEQFDIIALHGIFSWVSPENRGHIVNFIRKKLKVGGLVYISYNALPGWASAMPLRRLLNEHASMKGGPLLSRVQEGMSFLTRLKQANPHYLAHNPAVVPRIDKLPTMAPNYLAHEYYNKDWTPFYFSDVAAELSDAKLSHVGSAYLLDHVEAINLTPGHLQILSEFADPIQRETVRDFMTNQVFRRDVFIKGPVALPSAAALQIWLDTRFALTIPREDVPLTVKGSLGEANLHREVYDVVLDALADKPITLRQMVADPKVSVIDWARLTQALLVLVGSGHVQPCLPQDGDKERRGGCHAFNKVICERAKTSAELSYLASPVTGSGVFMDRFKLQFTGALFEGKTDPVAAVWNIMQASGQLLVKEGVTLQTPEENLAELGENYKAFTSKTLPILKRLGII